MRDWKSAAIMGLVALLFCGPARGAIIYLDGDSAALASGTVVFTQPSWDADVEYAVYAPGAYPGTHADKSTKYIYACQVFSDATSQATLASLSIGLLPAASAGGAGDDASYGATGGVAPLLSRVVGSPATSVQWTIDVDANEHSTVLLFSSPYSYTFEPATLTNAGQGDTEQLPSPVPEPATIGLLALGTLAMIRRKRT